jgi:threonine/homoserine/homoserine lactone efflux protein
VLTATLERGFRAGVATAIAPLLTDAPVILLSLVVLRRVPEWFLAGVTVVGGLFVAYIGVQTVIRARRPPPRLETQSASARDVWRGALVNLLSPHPWLFWFTVGTPYMIESWRDAPWKSIAFLAIFLGLLVGCKIGIAWAVARGRRFLDTIWYRVVMAICGVLLIGFGVALVWRVV